MGKSLPTPRFKKKRFSSSELRAPGVLEDKLFSLSLTFMSCLPAQYGSLSGRAPAVVAD